MPTGPLEHKESAHTQRRKGRGGGISETGARRETHRAHSAREDEEASHSRVMAPSKLAKQTRKVAPQNAAAAHRLAGWYAKGEEGLSQDRELAFKWELEAAERNCADAQHEIGVAYYDGTMGVQVDHAMAFAWFRKAALQGGAFPTYTSHSVCKSSN